MYTAQQTSLLMALLGELPLTEDSCVHVTRPSDMSFAPQEPWIFSASLRQNILFGKPFDINRYSRILKSVCLDKVYIYNSEFGIRTRIDIEAKLMINR